MNKPTNVAELFVYLEAHPWLREGQVPHAVFKARVDNRCRVLWKGKTAAYILFYVNAAVDDVETVFDDTGFTVNTVVTSNHRNSHRYDYTDDPEKPCPTPTQESIPAAT